MQKTLPADLAVLRQCARFRTREELDREWSSLVEAEIKDEGEEYR